MLKDMLDSKLQSSPQQAQFSQSEDYQQNYKIVTRSSQISLKYGFTLINKTIHILKLDQPSDSIHNIPILCSYADMQFVMSPEIQKDWALRLLKTDLHLGYMFLPSTRQAIVERIKQNTGMDFKKEDIVLINSMLTLYHLAVTQLTDKGDQVLIFTPTYYRFIYTLENQGRKIVQYELKTRQDKNGDSEFWIDFQELETIFSQNKIKMMIFANPHNPMGKIWSKQQIYQLKDLCIKYQCLIFSDDIFCDCIKNPKLEYTSLLQFPEIHNHLIWAGSFGKAFNCSGNSFAYAVIENQQIKLKIDYNILNLNLYPTFAAGQLLESCYGVGEQWRLITINYIEENFNLLKNQIKRRGMKVKLYKLECAFVPLLDFSSYKWSHSEIRKRLESYNIFPTFLPTCYIKKQKQSISCVRFNIAMNREIFKQLIDRLQKALEN